MSKRKSGIILAIIVLLTALLTVMDFASFRIPFIENGTLKYNSIGSTIGLGIDLKGGYYAVLTPKAAEGYDDNSGEDMFDSAVDILRSRLDNKGYTEATITIQGVGADREIRVEVPEVDDPEEVLKIIGSSGELTFEDEAGTVYLTGSDIKDCQGGYDKDGKPIVYLEFTTEGITKFSNATGKLVNQTLYIKLGGEIISQPTVNEQITNATAEITGLESYETAESIAAVIKAGKLPLEFEVGEANRISATLGENALKASVIAGLMGLLIIFAIMIVRYRGMGIGASLALTIYTAVMIVFLAIVPWVELTLPGIAGIILSIGMAVDANVIIFERIREEYAAGKTVASAVQAGFKRAFVTILDSNITTILASIVLLILCPGSIKGFAITLLIGVVLSMVTAIVVTRFILNLLMNLASNKSKFFNLKKEVLENDED
ncbi:MAG: protein translocase subunit SecD [Clostridia bacterium]|nr:protein translocase subunit SecD [Clostridia bacterium]